MAKISRMLLEEARTKMKDEDFFLSKVMNTHYQKMIEGICKAYHRVIKVEVVDRGSFVAMTNGDTIIVNLACDWIKSQKRRIDKYYLLIGLILHECGHILYTDFRLGMKCFEAVEKNKLFPSVSLSPETEELFEKKLGKKFVGIYKTLDNCIEDGHIEKRIIRYVPGYGECLMKVRHMHWSELKMNSYDELIKQADEKGEKVNRISVMVNLVLAYAKYGLDNTGDVIDDLTNAFYEMCEYIDNAVACNNAMQRKIEVNKAFDLLVKFILDDVEPEPESEEDKEEKSKSEEKKKSEESGSGSEEKEEDEAGESKAESESGESEAGESETGESEAGESEEKSLEEKLDEELKELSETLRSMAEESRHDGSSVPVDEKDETGEAEAAPDSSCRIEGTEGPEDWDLSYLEDKSAEEGAAKIIRNGIEKEMKKNADSTRKGRVDKFPSIEKYLEPTAEALNLYEMEHEELDRIARRVVKNLDKVIKERQKGSRQKGLYVGKQLDCAHAYRKDGKIFSNKKLPEKTPNMEVCVLVDCSGSMSYGERMDQSRRCAYVTWKFCQLMDIPCSVYGHTTEYPNEKHVLMYCVAHPKNPDVEDGKRIFALEPYANNRDGWAVNFCAEALSKSEATSRLLLIISDGVPAASGYGSTLGKRDCQEVVAKYKKKGIAVITAGIDDCSKEIRDIYLNGAQPKYAATFLDYSDMSKLPKSFATLIKKELL